MNASPIAPSLKMDTSSNSKSKPPVKPEPPKKAGFLDGVQTATGFGVKKEQYAKEATGYSIAGSLAGTLGANVVLQGGLSKVLPKKMRAATSTIAGVATAGLTFVSEYQRAKANDGQVDGKELTNVLIQSAINGGSVALSTALGSPGKGKLAAIGIGALDTGMGAGFSVVGNGFANMAQGKRFDENAGQSALMGAGGTLVGYGIGRTLSSKTPKMPVSETPVASKMPVTPEQSIEELSEQLTLYGYKSKLSPQKGLMKDIADYEKNGLPLLEPEPVSVTPKQSLWDRIRRKPAPEKILTRQEKAYQKVEEKFLWKNSTWLPGAFDVKELQTLQKSYRRAVKSGDLIQIQQSKETLLAFLKKDNSREFSTLWKARKQVLLARLEDLPADQKEALMLQATQEFQKAKNAYHDPFTTIGQYRDKIIKYNQNYYQALKGNNPIKLHSGGLFHQAVQHVSRTKQALNDQIEALGGTETFRAALNDPDSLASQSLKEYQQALATAQSAHQRVSRLVTNRPDKKDGQWQQLLWADQMDIAIRDSQSQTFPTWLSEGVFLGKRYQDYLEAGKIAEIDYTKVGDYGVIRSSKDRYSVLNCSVNSKSLDVTGLANQRFTNSETKACERVLQGTLTSLNVVNVAKGRIYHPSAEVVKTILPDIDHLRTIAYNLQTTPETLIEKILPQIHDLAAQAMPFIRGSSALTNMQLARIADARGIKLAPWKSDAVPPDLQSMLSPDFETFQNIYPALKDGVDEVL